MMFGPDTTVSWNDYRTSTDRQRLAIDFCLNRGHFSKDIFRRKFCLYGGAGYGGKSYLLRTAALEFAAFFAGCGVANPTGVLYCDTYENLKDRHIQKFMTEFQGFGVVSESQKYGLHLKFHEERFGVLLLRNIVDSSGAKQNRRTGRGAERLYALIDELTDLTYSQFGHVLYQVRPHTDGIPVSPILCGSNPDGIGHAWVKGVFIPKYRDPEIELNKVTDPRQFLFVQALKSDNPIYKQQREIIDANMAAIEDDDVRAARDSGSWDLYASGRFPMFSADVHGFTWPEFWMHLGIPETTDPCEFLENAAAFGCKISASLDYGTSPKSTSALGYHLVLPDRTCWTFATYGFSGMQLEEQGERILEIERNWEVDLRYCDPSMKAKAAEGSHGLNRIDRFNQMGIRFIPANNARVEGAATVAAMLRYSRSAATGEFTQRPAWRIHTGELGWPGARPLLKEIPSLARCKRNPEDVDANEGRNHWYDMARYKLHTHYRGGVLPKPEPAFGSLGWMMQRAEERQRQEKRPWWKNL